MTGKARFFWRMFVLAVIVASPNCKLASADEDPEVQPRDVQKGFARRAVHS